MERGHLRRRASSSLPKRVFLRFASSRLHSAWSASAPRLRTPQLGTCNRPPASAWPYAGSPQGGYVSPAYLHRQIQALDSVLPREKVLTGRAPGELDRTEENERARKAMTEVTAVAIDVGTRIQSIRGLQVLLDKDLATIYGVTTAALNQAVKRNEGRFPDDFRFQLKPEELANLKSQSVISSLAHGGRRFLPWAFTEHGAVIGGGQHRSSTAPARWR